MAESQIPIPSVEQLKAQGFIKGDRSRRDDFIQSLSEADGHVNLSELARRAGYPTMEGPAELYRRLKEAGYTVPQLQLGSVSRQLKEQITAGVASSGTVEERATMLGVSTPTFYTVRRRLGLVTTRRRSPEESMEIKRQVVDILQREGTDISVSTLKQILENQGYTLSSDLVKYYRAFCRSMLQIENRGVDVSAVEAVEEHLPGDVGKPIRTEQEVKLVEFEQELEYLMGPHMSSKERVTVVNRIKTSISASTLSEAFIASYLRVVEEKTHELIDLAVRVDDDGDDEFLSEAVYGVEIAEEILARAEEKNGTAESIRRQWQVLAEAIQEANPDLSMWLTNAVNTATRMKRMNRR